MTDSFNSSDRQRVSQIFEADAAAVERTESEYWTCLLSDSMELLHQSQNDEGARLTAVRSLRKLSRHGQALSLLGEGLRYHPSARLRSHYIASLVECNKAGEAIEFAKAASAAFPQDFLLRLQEALLLPLVYDSPRQVGYYRARFSEGLHRLTRDIRLDTPAERSSALAAIERHTNTYLGYQAMNDHELQRGYGQLVHRIMEANYPQWMLPIRKPCLGEGEPIRVGYISSRFRDLSATRFFLGWLRGHNRELVSVNSWHVGPKTDAVTEEVRRISSCFAHLLTLEDICQSIRSKDLHVLVFLDIGLDPLMTQLASLRLAPVQCMAWDHPVTSGLPNMDYAFSSALAEPDGAEQHYTEQLIKLPGVGVSYRKPAVPLPLLTRTRRDFGLRENSIVYLCCQSVFKFLPQNDHVFARIAKQVPNSQFVFIVTNEMVGADFQRRLAMAFHEAGLASENHCVFLPQLKHLAYFNLHRVSDIFLDTIGWSSGGSVFEAIACRVPVVTLRDRLMRGRQGHAILTQLEVPGTIASDVDNYVEVAVRLATEPLFHESTRERMVRGFPLLYSDERSVRSLEDFYRNCSL